MKILNRLQVFPLAIVGLCIITLASCKKDEEQEYEVPTISTTDVIDIKETSAVCGGKITNDGGSEITARGVCWSTSPNPTISNKKTTDGAGIGEFVSSLSGLSLGTAYYVRAYATNIIGTAYGEPMLFITDGSAGNISDNDGNTYTTIRLGTQTWMLENLRSITYNDGTPIPEVTDSTGWDSLRTPAYCWYNNQAVYANPYGALYNWHTVNTGKLCPTGWHVPTDAEWTILTNFLGGESTAGGKIKESGTIHWSHPNTGATNQIRFTALPGGYRYDNATFYGLGLYGYWWTSTEFNNKVKYRSLKYNQAYIDNYDAGMRRGFSVRCIKD